MGAADLTTVETKPAHNYICSILTSHQLQHIQKSAMTTGGSNEPHTMLLLLTGHVSGWGLGG